MSDVGFTTTKEAALKIALSMYLHEPCAICGKMFETLDDLEGTVWAGYSKDRPGRIAMVSAGTTRAGRGDGRDDSTEA